MLDYIECQNFKSLKNVGTTLTNLNLFMGLNGAGKSSLLHPILLFKQSKFSTNQRLTLSGDCIDLGLQKDILYQFSSEDFIKFKFRFNSQKEVNMQLNIIQEDSDIISYVVDAKSNINDGSDLINDLLTTIYSVKYISANRLGPQQEHTFHSSKIIDSDWGSLGENAISFLSEKGDQTMVHKCICFPNSKDNSLAAQVNEWMNVISPGVKVSAKKLAAISKTLLSFSFLTGGLATNNFRPSNVGFGLSYVLSIVIMLLTAKEGDCFIIENPEAHIHPKGQAELGRLLARVASTGAQLFVETHSDHVVNGIRVAVKQQIVAPNNVKILFFEKKNEVVDSVHEQYTTINEIKVDKNGELSDYPSDFLDEWINQMMELA